MILLAAVALPDWLESETVVETGVLFCILVKPPDAPLGAVIPLIVMLPPLEVKLITPGVRALNVVPLDIVCGVMSMPQPPELGGRALVKDKFPKVAVSVVLS
jgi:hypothetical protein